MWNHLMICAHLATWLKVKVPALQCRRSWTFFSLSCRRLRFIVNQDANSNWKKKGKKMLIIGRNHKRTSAAKTNQSPQIFPFGRVSLPASSVKGEILPLSQIMWAFHHEFVSTTKKPFFFLQKVKTTLKINKNQYKQISVCHLKHLIHQHGFKFWQIKSPLTSFYYKNDNTFGRLAHAYKPAICRSKNQIHLPANQKSPRLQDNILLRI